MKNTKSSGGRGIIVVTARWGLKEKIKNESAGRSASAGGCGKGGSATMTQNNTLIQFTENSMDWELKSQLV